MPPMTGFMLRRAGLRSPFLWANDSANATHCLHESDCNHPCVWILGAGNFVLTQYDEWPKDSPPAADAYRHFVAM